MSHQYCDELQPMPFISIPFLTPSEFGSVASEGHTNTFLPDSHTYFPPEQQAQQHRFGDFYPVQEWLPHGQFQPSTPIPQDYQTTVCRQPQSQQANGSNAVEQTQSTHSQQTSCFPNQKIIDDHTRGGCSNSENDDLTPAELRRKAQNRAAQLAFRGRKERHINNLEAKLASLKAKLQETVTENKELEAKIKEITKEYENLRRPSSRDSASPITFPDEPQTTSPLRYCPPKLKSFILTKGVDTPNHRFAEDGNVILEAVATWDLIVNHELFQKGLVDIQNVNERLRDYAMYDDKGPVYTRRMVLTAIEASAASGCDELL